MRYTTASERKKLKKEYKEYRARELKSLAKYAGREYASIGASVVNELGSLFTGVKATAPKKR